jgi:hypothetical protein
VVAEGNVIHDVDSIDEELQHALHASREEAQREKAARQRGGQYEHDGGSSQQQGGGLLGRFTRSSSNKGVACLEGSRGQAHSGRKPLKRKQG